MKRILKIFAVVVILSAMTAQSAMAGNDERRGTAGASELLINPWARSTGWGGVNISSVRGIDAMFNNAAGLAFVKNIEVAYTNTILYGGKSGFNSGASININKPIIIVILKLNKPSFLRIIMCLHSCIRTRINK